MANAPHGGELKDLVARDYHFRDQLIEESRTLPDIYLNEVSPRFKHFVCHEHPLTQYIVSLASTLRLGAHL
jgi:hypothetical protein